MNRKIKFRGKTTANGHWVYGNLIVRGEDHVSIQNSKSEPWVEPSTVGQFTCHHDKKGREIFEGDIVLCKGKHLYIVEWLTDSFLMRGKTYGGITSIKAFLPQEREVIGNIHDNPELLKVTMFASD